MKSLTTSCQYEDFATFRFGSTMYKNNSRNSSKFKGCSPLQLSSNLTGNCHAVGYYSYTNRWAQLSTIVKYIKMLKK